MEIYLTLKNKGKAPSAISSHTYCGNLDYEETGETIEFSRFIVRENEIAFDLLTEWTLGEHWRFSGVAKSLPNGAFLSDSIKGKQVAGGKEAMESLPVRFRFEIKKQSDRKIQISGIFFAPDEPYTFSGHLKKTLSGKHS